MKFLTPIFNKKHDTPTEHFSYATFYASELLAISDTGSARISLDTMSDSLLARQQPDGSWDTKTVGASYDTACRPYRPASRRRPARLVLASSPEAMTNRRTAIQPFLQEFTCQSNRPRPGNVASWGPGRMLFECL